MKVPIILKRGGKLKMAKEKEAKMLVRAGYATYQDEPQTYMTRELVAEAPKKRGRPKKVKEEVIETEAVEETDADEVTEDTETQED